MPAVEPKPDPRIAAYIAEVSVAGVPWVSRSHITLRHLNQEYGASTVQFLIDKHWAAMREYAVALKRSYADERCNGHTPLPHVGAPS